MGVLLDSTAIVDREPRLLGSRDASWERPPLFHPTHARRFNEAVQHPRQELKCQYGSRETSQNRMDRRIEYTHMDQVEGVGTLAQDLEKFGRQEPSQHGFFRDQSPEE